MLYVIDYDNGISFSGVIGVFDSLTAAQTIANQHYLDNKQDEWDNGCDCLQYDIIPFEMNRLGSADQNPSIEMIMNLENDPSIMHTLVEPEEIVIQLDHEIAAALTEL